jgi:D-amino-acid dehydrogenase
VVGMSVAIELARAGLAVTVLERESVGGGASHGNAGLLVPSHCLPLARPAALLDGAAALLGADAPLRLRPWQGREELAWLARLAAACLPGLGARTAPRLRELAAESIDWYSRLAAEESPDFDLRRSGWLSVFTTWSTYRKGLADARRKERLGVRWAILGREDLTSAAPGLEGRFVGAILYPDDWALSPDRLLNRLELTARKLGVQVRTGVEVTEITLRGRRATAVRGPFGDLALDQLVISAGWETERWLRRLGSGRGIWPGRGYSITVSGGPLRFPLNVVDLHLVISSPGERVRATWGLDFGIRSLDSDRQRIEALRSAARSVLPHLRWDSPLEEWAGSRPMTANGMPVVGRVGGWENVLAASGHGMLGMSLAPASARMVRRLITGDQAGPRS